MFIRRLADAFVFYVKGVTRWRAHPSLQRKKVQQAHFRATDGLAHIELVVRSSVARCAGLRFGFAVAARAEPRWFPKGVWKMLLEVLMTLSAQMVQLFDTGHTGLDGWELRSR